MFVMTLLLWFSAWQIHFLLWVLVGKTFSFFFFFWFCRRCRAEQWRGRRGSSKPEVYSFYAILVAINSIYGYYFIMLLLEKFKAFHKYRIVSD